jgi:hypothetical protein
LDRYFSENELAFFPLEKKSKSHGARTPSHPIRSPVSDCLSTLAKHFANLFTRDPLYVTDKQVYLDDEDSTTIFAFKVVLYLKIKKKKFFLF